MDLFSWVQDTPSWALLLGVFAPLATALVNQPRWSGAVKQLMAVVVAVVLGVVGCLADGTLTEGMTVLQVVAVVAVASQISYRTLLGNVAKAVEAGTSPGGS